MIQEIKSRISLVNYIGRYVKLKRHGGKNWGLCPFHGEKTASFTVGEKGYYCFGCHEHGDLIDFAVAYHRKDVKEIVREFASEVGVEMKPLPPKKPLVYVEGALDPTGLGERELLGIKDVDLWAGADMTILGKTSGYLTRRGAEVRIQGQSPTRWIVARLGSVKAVREFVLPFRETDKEIYLIEAEEQFGFKNSLRLLSMGRVRMIDFKNEALEYLETKRRD